MATPTIEEGVQRLDLGVNKGAQDGVEAGELDQATLFRAVQDGNVNSLDALLKNRKVDINAYNSEGATALLLAIYKFDAGRNVELVKTLLKYGADVSIKAAPPPSVHKISIARPDKKHIGGGVQETRKITSDHKTPLLVALELKSSLYVKGWEYRHWDPLIHVLAEATIKFYDGKDLKSPSSHNPNAVSHIIQNNWDAVFKSGKHELVELVAEGKDIVALKLLVTGASKILKLNFVETNRFEIHDASYNLTKAMVHFLYVGKLDPAFIKQRGIDLFVTAHKYGVEALKGVLEASIVPTQDNWIKLLTAAVESNANVLTLKVAHSIKDLLDGRQSVHGFHKKSFSDFDGSPHQLFSGQSNNS